MSLPRSTDYSAVRDDLLHQSPEAISAMFGRVAARYDIMNFAMGGGLDLYWRRRLVQAVAAQQPRPHPGPGPGRGRVLPRLEPPPAFPGRAIGADFCLPM